MDSNSPSMLKPTLIGGLIFGVIGAIPYLGALNCACCALVMGGGFLAAYLYSNQCKSVGAEFRPGSGALVGLVAGMFYAIANTAVAAFSMPKPEEIDEIIGMMEEAGMPPDAIDSAAPFLDTMSHGAGILFYFFFMLLIAAVFSTIGGLIGGSVFKVEPAPPAPPAAGMVPPPPAPPGGGTAPPPGSSGG